MYNRAEKSSIRRLAAIDIDETLLGPDGKVGQENRAAIRRLQEAGVEVMLASGRALVDTMPFYRSLGLTGYVISEGGASATHPTTGEVIHRQSLIERSRRIIIQDGLTRGMSVFAFGTKDVYGARHDQWTRQYTKDTNGSQIVEADLLNLPESDILKIIWANDPSHLLEIEPTVKQFYLDQASVVITNPYYLEFTALGVNKALALAKVAAHLNIPQENVIAFGDGNNDKEMLAWAGLGVAMEHGKVAAHEAADFVSPPGDPETALARSIERILDEEFARVSA